MLLVRCFVGAFKGRVTYCRLSGTEYVQRVVGRTNQGGQECFGFQQ